MRDVAKLLEKYDNMPLGMLGSGVVVNGGIRVEYVPIMRFDETSKMLHDKDKELSSWFERLGMAVGNTFLISKGTDVIGFVTMHVSNIDAADLLLSAVPAMKADLEDVAKGMGIYVNMLKKLYTDSGTEIQFLVLPPDMDDERIKNLYETFFKLCGMDKANRDGANAATMFVGEMVEDRTEAGRVAKYVAERYRAFAIAMQVGNMHMVDIGDDDLGDVEELSKTVLGRALLKKRLQKAIEKQYGVKVKVVDIGES